MPIVQDIRTALQQAIKTGNTGVKTVRSADVSADPLPQTTYPGSFPLDTFDAQISFLDCVELGRTSTKILEQYVYNINLTATIPNLSNAKQSDLDTFNNVTQQVRDLLLSFSMDGVRTEQLISSRPFGFEAALQGQYEYKFAVDLDVIRTIGTKEPPAITDTGDETPVMSKTRQAVWDAIDNWPAFADAWTRKFKTDDDLEELSLHDAGLADLPGIAVSWGPVDPKWWVNVMQQWHQQLVVTFWLPANWRAVAEWRLIQLMQAFYQSASVDRPNVSYIRAATGRPPEKTSPINLQLVALGRAQKLHAWQGQIALTLPINFDPNGN